VTLNSQKQKLVRDSASNQDPGFPGHSEFKTVLQEWANASFLYKFIYDNGHYYKSIPLPKDVPMGVPKECYHNAAILSLALPDLTYVEGVARGILPVSHAWCINESNEVVDNTWPYNPSDEYFGIAFNREYIAKRVFKYKKAIPLIDDWEADWPLINDKRLFKEALFVRKVK
jgi:hypothetical protein